MNFLTRSFRIVALAAVIVTPTIVRAQPNPPPPPVENPAAADKQALDKAMQEMIDKFKKMTPAEMRDFTRDLQEKMLRAQLSSQGFNDLELQEILIDWLNARNSSREAVRAVATRLRDAAKNKTTPDAQVKSLLAELQTAADTEQAKRDEASEKLAARLKLEEHPRLEALLHLNGFIGDELWSLSDLSTGIGAFSALGQGDATPAVDDAAIEKGAAMGREIGEKIARMTPAQMRDYVRELQEERLRAALTEYGFGADKTQTAIIDWLRAQNAARTDMRLVAAGLRDLIANPDADEFKLLQTLSVWQKNAGQEALRRENAIAQLRQNLKLDENPRLDALLHLHGIVGDEAWQLGDALGSGVALALLPTSAEIKAGPVK